MNSLDDFAALRPEHDAATDAELATVWVRVAGESRADEQPERRPSRSGRRRFALLGAAASLAVGVVAVAAVSDRAVAPPAASDTTVVESATPTVAPGSTMDPTISNDESTSAGEPPRWGITESGWTLAVFEDQTRGPLGTVRLFAGPDGLATSWVAIVSGMSEPLLPAGVEPAEDAGATSPISSQRVATEEGSMAVIAGGVSDDEAMAVFGAVQDGGSPPAGFVETDSADAAVRTIRYRFVHDDGETIDIEVQGAGVPRYEIERSAATAEEFWDATAGVDESNIAYVGEYTLLLRNGFWVTRVVTSAPPDAPTTFTRLAELVEIVSEDEWAAALPAPIPVASPQRLALGASVMLGPAAQMAEAGFVVDAAASRSFVEGLEIVRSLASEGRLPETLVVDLAANSVIRDEEMAEMVDLLVDVESVVFVTTRAGFVENESNNELIRSLPQTHPNVEVVDWAELADSCPGDCFSGDGLHLTDDGRRYYVEMVVDVTG